MRNVGDHRGDCQKIMVLSVELSSVQWQYLIVTCETLMILGRRCVAFEIGASWWAHPFYCPSPHVAYRAR